MKNGAYRYRYAPFLFYDHTPIGAGSFFAVLRLFLLAADHGRGDACAAEHGEGDPNGHLAVITGACAGLRRVSGLIGSHRLDGVLGELRRDGDDAIFIGLRGQAAVENNLRACLEGLLADRPAAEGIAALLRRGGEGDGVVLLIGGGIRGGLRAIDAV